MWNKNYYQLLFISIEWNSLILHLMGIFISIMSFNILRIICSRISGIDPYKIGLKFTYTINKLFKTHQVVVKRFIFNVFYI